VRFARLAPVVSRAKKHRRSGKIRSYVPTSNRESVTIYRSKVLRKKGGLFYGPIHISEATQAALAERAHWLTVEWLPKYAPELNDIEIVWGDLKAPHLAQGRRRSGSRSRGPSRLV
jgi:hypothetical protein